MLWKPIISLFERGVRDLVGYLHPAISTSVPIESTFCVPDRPTQKMRFLCSRLGSTRPTDPPRAARRKFLGRNDPTD